MGELLGSGVEIDVEAGPVVVLEVVDEGGAEGGLLRWISFAGESMRTSIMKCAHLASPGWAHDQSPELTHGGGEDV